MKASYKYLFLFTKLYLLNPISFGAVKQLDIIQWTRTLWCVWKCFQDQSTICRWCATGASRRGDKKDCLCDQVRAAPVHHCAPELCETLWSIVEQYHSVAVCGSGSSWCTIVEQGRTQKCPNVWSNMVSSIIVHHCLCGAPIVYHPCVEHRDKAHIFTRAEPETAPGRWMVEQSLEVFKVFEDAEEDIFEERISRNLFTL